MKFDLSRVSKVFDDSFCMREVSNQIIPTCELKIRNFECGSDRGSHERVMLLRVSRRGFHHRIITNVHYVLGRVSTKPRPGFLHILHLLPCCYVVTQHCVIRVPIIVNLEHLQ